MDWSGIVIHHSASGDVSANEIDRWHRERGWKEIGYHFVIRTDGSIEPARDFRSAGAHAYGRNTTHLGICLTGHFGQYPPEKEQVISLIQLVRGCINRWDISSVERHHEHCPGQYLPWNFFKNAIDGRDKYVG